MTKNLYKSTNILYDVNNFMAIAAVGIIIKLFVGQGTSESGETGPASSTLWGYGTVLLSLMGMLFVIFALASKSEFGKNAWDFVKVVAEKSLPVVLMILILYWILGMNLAYFQRINKGTVATEFNQFSNISTMLIVFQLFILYKYLKDLLSASKPSKAVETPLEKINELLSQQMEFITYLLTTINLIVAGMMQVIIKYFSTDG